MTQHDAEDSNVLAKMCAENVRHKKLSASQHESCSAPSEAEAEAAGTPTIDALCKYQPQKLRAILRYGRAQADQVTDKQAAPLKGVASVSDLSQQTKRLRSYHACRAACRQVCDSMPSTRSVKQGLPRTSQKRGLKAVPLLQQDIFQVDGVLTEAEAARFVETAERNGFEHQGSRGAAFGEAHRDNERIAFQDADFAQHLWQMSGLADIFESVALSPGQHAVGLNSNIRLYKYGPGQCFGKHVDDSVELANGQHTEYTLLIYLSGAGKLAQQTKQKSAMKGSSGLVGGETIFYGQRGKAVASVTPKAGRALLHRHGDACLEHEAAAVKAGLKHILRSDVCFANN